MFLCYVGLHTLSRCSHEYPLRFEIDVKNILSDFQLKLILSSCIEGDPSDRTPRDHPYQKLPLEQYQDPSTPPVRPQ